MVFFLIVSNQKGVSGLIYIIQKNIKDVKQVKIIITKISTIYLLLFFNFQTKIELEHIIA